MSDANIHPTAIIEDGVTIGAETSVWDNVHIRFGTRIGTNCIIGEKTYIAYDVEISDLVKINNHVSICTGVTIETGCMVAAHVVFTNDVTPRAADGDFRQLLPSEPDDSTLRTVVGRGATIGANATIGPGLTLGSFCMVGMGAVVTRNVIPHGQVTGNPARLRGLVRRDGKVIWRTETGDLPPDGTIMDCDDGTRLEIKQATPHLLVDS